MSLPPQAHANLAVHVARAFATKVLPRPIAVDRADVAVAVTGPHAVIFLGDIRPIIPGFLLIPIFCNGVVDAVVDLPRAIDVEPAALCDLVGAGPGDSGFTANHEQAAAPFVAGRQMVRSLRVGRGANSRREQTKRDCQSGRQRPLSSCSFSDAPWTAQKIASSMSAALGTSVERSAETNGYSKSKRPERL